MLRETLDLDFVVVNGENAAGGFGITPKICNQFFDAGIDAITTGNHVFDQREIIPHFDRENRLLRPHNYPKTTPGAGVAIFEATRGRKQAIKLLLLDQRIVAGLGNIYVCEALWRARISPRRAGGRISLAALERLVVAIREVLEQSIRDGGSTLRDYARPDGELGYFSTRFDVYGRTGESCHRKDGGQIVRFEQGGRSTWYCAKCQK